MTESELQVSVADYIRLHYPNVLFHSDFGSGIKLTKGQAIKQKRQNGGRRGWPDMFIANRRYDLENYVEYHGLFLELKKDGEKLLAGNRAKNRFLSIDGKEYKTEHLKEQADVIYALNQSGYIAKFAVGFEEAKQIIDDYLGDKQCHQ